jgi:hypothetical protein
MAQASAISLPTPGVVRIVGRIDGVKAATVNGRPGFRTLVIQPASDPYQSPATFDVRSAARLGSAGQEVDVVCNLRGYKRTGVRKDNGEKFVTSEIALDAIAA